MRLPAPSGLDRLASLALPRRDRDTILADLHEESARSPRPRRWIARQALGIAAHHHLECYRDPADRDRVVMLLVAGIAILTIVPAASTSLFAGVAVFTDPVGRAIVAMWRASHLTAAVAAGLLVGRAPWLADHVGAARSHVAMVLIAVGLATHGIAAGSAAGIALAAAAWLAAGNRRAVQADTHLRAR